MAFLVKMHYNRFHIKVLLFVGMFCLGIFYLYFAGILYNGGDASEPSSNFQFASYYQDNMVLQASPDRAVIWGYGTREAKIEVSLNVYTKYNTTVDKVINGAGVWSVTFDPQQAGTRGIISAIQMAGGMMSIYRISNIVFGDVWVCGGQSNMEFPLAHIFNSSETLRNVSNYPDIRIFTAAQVASLEPLYDLENILQNWAVPTPETAQYFSAVCWLYAQFLFDRLHIPIGLISSNWGGTPIETWSSPRALSMCGLSSRDDTFIQEHAIPHHSLFPSLIPSNPKFIELAPPPDTNSVLWNAMIHPLIKMTIKGAIWYQGEANSRYHRDLYNCTFPAMIHDWRRSWFEATGSQTDVLFPFGFVQLCTLSIGRENEYYPLIRWHQTADHGYVPNKDMLNTFMAVTLDLPDPTSPFGSVHTRDKQDDSRRLAAAALKHVYKDEKKGDGPFPVTAQMNFLNTVQITYGQPDLKVYANATENFEVCCSHSLCEISDVSLKGLAEWMPARILSYDIESVTIYTDKCENGVKKVRYAWATTPCQFKKCQIYNKYDFPAPPFVMDVTSK